MSEHDNIKCEPEEDTCSNSSDPDRLEIEDRDDREDGDNREDCDDREDDENRKNQETENTENIYDMTVSKKIKVESNYDSSESSTANCSPINRMDTPESNCSDTNIDQETTKLWQALAK